MTILPQDTHRTLISVSLRPGPTDEPPVTTKEYLSSFLEYACWLRVISARENLRVLERKDSRELERLAALASFNQLAAQITEDALTTYVAWSIWAINRDLALPDIVERLSMRMSKPTKALPADYVQEVCAKMRDTAKRVDVHPREYLSILLKEPNSRLPLALGIAWKKQPSVKLVSEAIRPFWDDMGQHIRDVIEALVDEKGALLASTYNKIKHGPQLIVTPIAESAKRRGEMAPDSESYKKVSVRLLLAGSRVQETSEETAANVRCAPFLVDDLANTRRWFYRQMVHNVNYMFLLGTWLFNTTYVDDKRDLAPKRSEILEIVREQEQHHDTTPWPL